jgi:hypothetical protein
MESYHRRRSHYQPSVRYLLYFSVPPYPVVCCWHAVSSSSNNLHNLKSYLQFLYIFLNSSELPNIQGPIYFNRTDVKKAINAPLDVDWMPCSLKVFNTSDGDESLPSSFTVLPSVIEKNHRTVVVHGLADYDLIAEGFVCMFLFFLSLSLLQNIDFLFIYYFQCAILIGQESRSKSMFFLSFYLQDFFC